MNAYDEGREQQQRVIAANPRVTAAQWLLQGEELTRRLDTANALAHRLRGRLDTIDLYLLTAGSGAAESAAPPAGLLPAPEHDLSERELEVLQGMSEGNTNARIGSRLHISEDAVKVHARGVFRKLGARDRAHAVAIGYQRGILTRALTAGDQP